MLILNQSSKPVKVTFSYPGKAHFPLKHLRRYNITPEGTDGAWTTWDVPCPRTVCALPHLSLGAPTAMLVSPENHPNRWGALTESPQKRYREQENAKKKSTRNIITWFPFKERQSKAGLWFRRSSPVVTPQWPIKSSTVVREQIPSHDTGTGGNLWKEPLAG